ncbi:hypothetical protein CLOM_g14934 [Closterium sp. NIES-68]|nr:hypothetical protein CLOM_g14934 [Closterium sp. NIES-68]GJP84222.1 hypothetical protein CLOP_g14309 [Closterium sp. NIES-67]
MAARQQQSRGAAVGAWAGNVGSSVALVMVNKVVMSRYAFHFATTLTALHFAVTGIVGWLGGGARRGSPCVPLRELVAFSVVANASIVGMNFSLMLNTVGFYQIAKLSVLPTVCVLEFALHGRRYSPLVLGAIALVVAGVAVCTVTDVSIRPPGLAVAALAVAATALQQVGIAMLHSRHAIDSMSLLSLTAPTQAASLLLLGPSTDQLLLAGQSLWRTHVSAAAWACILLSCVLAIFCNLTQYLCISMLSPTSFQVLGNMKTVLVLVLGWMLFDSSLTPANVVGMAMAVSGMVLYSYAAHGKGNKGRTKANSASADASEKKHK